MPARVAGEAMFTDSDDLSCRRPYTCCDVKRSRGKAIQKCPMWIRVLLLRMPVIPAFAIALSLLRAGATGIGESIVAHFARQGARVAFLDIQDEAACALVEALAGRRMPCAVLPALRSDGY